jgi:Fe-S-cluster containining protein
MSGLVEQAFQEVTTHVEIMPERATLACAQGCAFCCYHPVDITPLEAFAIVAYLQRTLSPPAYDVVVARLTAQAERISTWSYTEHAQARLPCALLVEGTCSVYAWRPFACRAWNSTTVAPCEAIFTQSDPISMIPTLDMRLYETVWGVARHLAAALRRWRLDGTSYELHSLLRRVLETPDAVQRWGQGEDIFAGCKVGAFTA